MTQTRDAPTHNRYSHFRCEEGTVTDVNRKNWTVTVETRHSSKGPNDIQCLVPYTHVNNGEGIHFLPEVGAICMLAWPNDNTPPFIMGFKGAAGVQTSQDGRPERSTADPEGSDTDVSFQSRRPDLNPGDIAVTTRDENFIYLRRGGIVQIGATPISQRVYVPVLNYIRDYCENYSMSAFGGDVTWSVLRQESDPRGGAAATYVFHMNAEAQDAEATVRVRYMPLEEPGSASRGAWEVRVAPKGIARDTGEVTGEVYSLYVTTDGDETQILAGSREITIKGDDLLRVSGGRTVRVGGDDTITADGAMRHIASGEAVLGGSQIKLGGRAASSPAVKGTELLTWFASAQWIVGPSGTATLSPASLAQLQQILSTKVFVE
jgi:hypothetical protein